jgi:CheY-like chemotaxis protein
MDLSRLENAQQGSASVLLIDDDEYLREALGLVLERNGFAVTACPDGQAALERLRSEPLPDVILLDLKMPRMDGWHFRLKQRSHARWSVIPIAVLSADHSAKAAVIDADVYLPKPVDNRQLVTSVARLADEARRRRGGITSARLRPLGKLANEVVRHAEAPLGAALGNLQLAQVKAGELGARLRGPDAFSMVGIRQLLERAQCAVQRLEAVVQGTAAFAQLAGEQPLRGAPRVLLVDVENVGDDSLESKDEYELVQASVAEALERLRAGERFELILCDVSARSLQGIGFHQRLLAMAPNQAAHIVFVIGSTVDAHLRDFLDSTRCRLLRRPFGREELRELLVGHSCLLN